MGRMGSCFQGNNHASTVHRPQSTVDCRPWTADAIVSGLTLVLICAPVWAEPQEFTVSASVDKTTVNVGNPIQFTLTIAGDVSGLEVPPLEFPEGFIVAARSQATNVAFRAGGMQRSTSLVFVLVPRQPGTFQLGPFELSHNEQVVKTEPIAVTVQQSALPPPRTPTGERFTL
ncbi:MAG: hypothetical protein COV75_03520 [Candidatus Omnitrophica bacterium CG11_big_fil_rev_8_21_14_0_20_63_9]|nr:MAG: hypothetical protein COV75_03520 [Candidatus Omnitrophica bacterium CG11_big_fil_rev_8_21_14_0_20_63_9]